eukprot:TRINITY_DN68098_c8_g3_i1.p1 TRINITY_DN68098_c8_g3~~TRINITY_DN68098_c8_g3_i1.p1  ORF type:complete len:245 (-),score=5.13 TRINITY_DN68098_c8_g3_i1:32-766(-)
MGADDWIGPIIFGLEIGGPIVVIIGFASIVFLIRLYVIRKRQRVWEKPKHKRTFADTESLDAQPPWGLITDTWRVILEYCDATTLSSLANSNRELRNTLMGWAARCSPSAREAALLYWKILTPLGDAKILGATTKKTSAGEALLHLSESWMTGPYKAQHRGLWAYFKMCHERPFTLRYVGKGYVGSGHSLVLPQSTSFNPSSRYKKMMDGEESILGLFLESEEDEELKKSMAKEPPGETDPLIP